MFNILNEKTFKIRIVSSTNNKYKWYADRIGDIFEVWPIEESTLTHWDNAKSKVGRNGAFTNPVMVYLTMISVDNGTTFFRICPNDCVDEIVAHRNDLLEQLI